MNRQIIAGYLQLLRKKHNYTQDDLAGRLQISRQAISKWETGETIPDLEILLKLSKLYGLTVNELLEPDIRPQKITDFEQISEIPEEKLKETLEQFEADAVVIASMGASPEINFLLERLCPDIDFIAAGNKIGRVRAELVEDMQSQIISMVNLQALERKG